MGVSTSTRSTRTGIVVVLLAFSAMTLAACGGSAPGTPAETVKPAAPAADPGAPAPAADDPDAPLPPPAFETALPEGVRNLLAKPFTGDFDEMVARRMIRVGVTFNRTFYFVDKGVQRGAAYEFGKAFEDELNKKLKTGNAKVNVVFVPLPRDVLAEALLKGNVDVVVAQVTVRPELQALVDFSIPTRTNVSEVVVTGPGAPAISSADDLSGRDVYTRKNSKYYDSLVALNERLKAKGRPAAVIRDVPGQPRRRRPARDGQRGHSPGHRRRRLPGGILEEGVHEHHRP